MPKHHSWSDPPRVKGAIAKPILHRDTNAHCTPPADDILFKKGVYVVPDILTNAGGVTVSYFEWVQNLQQFKWSEDDVNKKLEDKMVNAFNEVFELKKSKQVPMRIASFMVAIDRVHVAYKLREG